MAAPGPGQFYRFGPAIVPQADNFTKQLNYNFAQLATGSWTPSDQSGAGLTFSAVSVSYTQIGNLIHVYGRLTFPVTASGANLTIGGLPFTCVNQLYGIIDSPGFSATYAKPVLVVALPNTTTFIMADAGTGVQLTNAQVSNGLVAFNVIYPLT